MKFIADFHIHSRFSRATSKELNLRNLARWAEIKGIKVLATGDFTHPLWFKELKEGLEPAELGLFKVKKQLLTGKNGASGQETRFILTTEISCIYTKNNRVRKIHVLIFAPNFEAVEKINTRLDWIGNLKADGRPILGLDAKELLKIILQTSPDCLVVPAHCLLPDTYLHSNPGIKMIKDVSVGDKVYTHIGRLKKVKQIYNRFYKGPIYNIKPYNFRIGLKTTPEHPFYAIKSYTNCTNMSHSICKKDCAYIKRRNCSHRYFESYKPQWIKAEDIKKGDILIFPRFNTITKDVKEIRFSDYLSKKQFKVFKDKIACTRGRIDKKLSNAVKVDKAFCRLVGYYVSEGYTDNRDSISFCFKRDERKYIRDLKFLMKKSFGLSSPRIYKRKNADSIEIIYFSKILAKIFSQLFYSSVNLRRAHTKCLPSWMLNLPLEKQVEIFKGWWRGDVGCTSSRGLMNQMKIILLRLGIISSISEQSKEDFNEKYIHKIGNRVIHAQHNQFIFHGLSFFQDLFGLLKDPCFNQKRFKTKLTRRHGWIDERYIYIPVKDIEIENYEGKVYNLEVEGDNSYLSEFVTVHNCMTPWFAIFGSKSGFNSVEECFDEYSKYIFALETGLSADPKMCWRLSSLDRYTLISNSDSHSLEKIGREANVFSAQGGPAPGGEGEALSYGEIIKAIKRTSQSLKLIYTIEFFPEEGKYHYDGHRLCQVSFSPKETIKSGGTCPVCGKPLTIGVLSRVEELADKPEGRAPEGAIPFKSLVPLKEIIGEALGTLPGSKKVEEEYQNLIKKLGSEFNILIETNKEGLAAATLPEIVEGISRVREGKLVIEPGYDGVFGKVKIFSQGEQKIISKQKSLF